MNVTKNGHTLRKASKKYGFTYDKKHKYIISDPSITQRHALRDDGYELRFFDGCFYPFLVSTH